MENDEKIKSCNMKKQLFNLFTVASFCSVFLISFSMRAQVPSYVPVNGLDGWWSFNGNANDLSGNGNNGIVNGASLTDDRNGNTNSAYLFDGTSSYIGLSSPFFNGSTSVASFTYFAEFKLNQLPTTGTAYSISTKEGFWRSIGFFIYDDGSISFGGSQPNPQGYFSVAAPTNSIISNQWYCLVVTFENSILNLFIDGQLIASSTINYSTFDFSWVASGNSTATNYLGAAHPVSPGITNYFNGIIDNFGTWDRSLNLEERNILCQNCQTSLNTQPSNQSLNLSASTSAQFSVTSSATSSTYQWQTNLGVGFQNLSDAGQFAGTSTNTLFVNNITISNNNQQFRCIVTDGNCDDTTDVAVLTVIDDLGIDDLQNNSTKKLLKITDLNGKEIPFKKNTVLLFIYEDGRVERVYEGE
jgi:hypothetical protein